MAGKSNPENRRPRPRRRLFRVLAVACALAALLLAIAATVAYQRRVELINRYLATSGLPFEATVGTLDIGGLSDLSLDDVQLRLPGIDTPFLTFSSSASNLAVGDLLDGNIADLQIAGANIIVDDALLATLTGARSPGKTKSDRSDPLVISKLSLENTRVTLRLSGLPEISFNLDHVGENIRLGDGLPVTGPQQLQLSDIVVTLDGSAARIPALDATFSAAGDTGGLHVGALAVDSPSLTLTQALLDRFTAPPRPGAASPPAEPLPFPITIDSVELTNLQLNTPAGLRTTPPLPFDLPAGTATVSVSGGPITLAADRTLVAAPQKITATASLGDLLTIRSLAAEIAVTDSRPTLTSLHIDAHVDLPSSASFPATTADIRLGLSDIALTADGPRSTSPQSLNVTNFSASLGSSSARITSLVASLRPDSLIDDKRLDSLLVSGVQLKIDPADFPSGQGQQETTPAPGNTSPPAWHGLNIAELSVSGSTIETSPAPQLGIPGATASFAVTTTAKTPDNSTYRATVDHLRLTSGTSTIATARSITVDADPASLWNRNRVTRIAVDGVNLTVDQTLLDATTPTEKAAATTTATPAPVSESSAWTLGELALTQSTVIIDDLVPGLPPLPLAISTTLSDIPLSNAGMKAASQPQSVTVSNARLRSRLNPLLDVARFDDVTLHFTFRDLLQQKIDRISIEHPVLFVGEHLFWYVDYFRKFEAPATDPSAADDTPAPGWDVRVVEANNGELVLAPKGSPLTELPKLPFSGKTSIVDSKLSFAIDSEGEPGQTVSETRPLLSLTVPEGDYPLKSFNLGLEIDLKGLRGDIAFNLPIQQRTNNLVQTLYADELWFKNIGAKEVYLAVTYDQQGIYAQFGGEAYGGYAEGAFNLYNDDAYSWDGWVAGTTISLSPLTTALTPEYLEMTGTADAKFIAQGNFVSFDDITATGSLTTAEGGGKIDLLALGDLGESLVEDAEPIAAALTTAGLNVLRYFDYDTAKVNLEMFGREGDVNLDLRGPSGVRQINITAHDYRNSIATKPKP